MPPVNDLVRARLLGLDGRGEPASLGETITFDAKYWTVLERAGGFAHGAKLHLEGVPLERIVGRAADLLPGREPSIVTQTRPQLARFIDRIEVVDVDSDQLAGWWRETGDPAAYDAAAGRPAGVALPELGAVFAHETRPLIRFGIGDRVAVEITDRPELLERFVNVVLLRHFRNGLEAQVLSGSGVRDATEENITGIENVDGVTVVELEVADTRLDGILEAVRDLTARGYGPFVAAVHPDDLLAMKLEPAAEVLADVLATTPELELVASAGVTAGTTVVGDVDSGVTLLRQGTVLVELSHEDRDNVLRGLVTARLQTHVDAPVDPAAWVLVRPAA